MTMNDAERMHEFTEAGRMILTELARLRVVEAAAREYLEHDNDFSPHAKYAARQALRAALEVKP